MIGMIFFNLGRDSYSKFAKISIFILLVLIPFIITFTNTIASLMAGAMDMPENEVKQFPPQP